REGMDYWVPAFAGTTAEGWARPTHCRSHQSIAFSAPHSQQAKCNKELRPDLGHTRAGSRRSIVTIAIRPAEGAGLLRGAWRLPQEAKWAEADPGVRIVGIAVGPVVAVIAGPVIAVAVRPGIAVIARPGAAHDIAPAVIAALRTELFAGGLLVDARLELLRRADRPRQR